MPRGGPRYRNGKIVTGRKRKPDIKIQIGTYYYESSLAILGKQKIRDVSFDAVNKATIEELKRRMKNPGQ